MDEGGPRVGDVLERDFERALLSLERLRVNLLLGAMCGLFFLLGVLFVAADPSFGEASDRASLRFISLLVVGLGIPLPLLIRRRVDRAIAEDTPLPRRVRLVGVLYEVAAPTALILSFTAFLRPSEALTAPPVLGYLVLCMLATLSMDFVQCVAVGAASALAYAGLAYAFQDAIASDFPGSFLSIWPPYVVRSAVIFAAGLVAAFITREIRKRVVQALRSRREHDRVRDLFGQHVSPAVVEELLRGPAPQPAERRVTVLFVDVRGFTRFSAERSPRGVIDYLNRLFGPLAACVDRHRGFINKFLGDGFMAVFGAPIDDPEAERRAVAAAREILAEVTRLVAAGEIPPTELGIGVHAGVAVTGNVGSEDRKEYTIIGDTVNLAARIEQLNKEHGSHLLASEAVVAALGADVGDARCLGPVAIRGRSEPVVLYRLA